MMDRAYDNLQIEYGRLLDAIREINGLAMRSKRYIDEKELNTYYLKALQNAEDNVVQARTDISDAVREFAIDDVYMQAKENEEFVFDNIKKAAASAGAELTGTEFRLKTRDSLSRKISTAGIGESAADSRNLVWGEVAGDIKDALRFTMLLPFVGFVDAYRNAQSVLENAGFRFVHVKNTFANENHGYRGINTNLVHDATNYLFELQFHTTKSFHVKEFETHKYYEITRDPKNEGTPEFKDALKKQEELFDTIPVPEGVETIESF